MKAPVLDRLPWACLLTGDTQRTCSKNVESASRTIREQGNEGVTCDQGDESCMTEPGSEEPGTTEPGSTEPGTEEPSTPPEMGEPVGEPGDPVPPSSCEPTAWEGYFRDHATFEYQRHGVNIDFPQEIFDALADFTSLAIASANVPVTEGAPSCHEGEWAMREGAWFDATMEGCLNLNNAILVMCQQAANYAPTVGACNATGTW
jgi:hypothetical protein